jgi:hypothetical protein
LVSLQSLHLGYNRIGDVGELERHLSSLHHLVNVAMNNNPVARRQLYRPTLLYQLPALRWIDGREASWEERERAEMLLSRTERPAQLYMQVRKEEDEYEKTTTTTVLLEIVAKKKVFVIFKLAISF